MYVSICLKSHPKGWIFRQIEIKFTLDIIDNCHCIIDNVNCNYKNFAELSYYVWKLSKNNHINDADTIENPAASNLEFLKYFVPLVQTLKELGGSATRQETHKNVIELMDISEEEISVKYEKSGESRVLKQIGFARDYLAHERIISKEVRGVWPLTERSMNVEMTDELVQLIYKNGSVSPELFI